MRLMETQLLADVDSVSSVSEQVRIVGLEKVAKLCKHMTLEGGEGRRRRC